jgi:hypothetical protein
MLATAAVHRDNSIGREAQLNISHSIANEILQTFYLLYRGHVKSLRNVFIIFHRHILLKTSTHHRNESKKVIILCY